MSQRACWPALLAALVLGCGSYAEAGGDESQLGEIEQDISNAIQVDSDGRHARANLQGGSCSAELINNEWFITADHCFVDRNQDTVLRWGTADSRYSADVHRHPVEDLALVKVSPPMKIDGSTSGFNMPLYPWTGSWLTNQVLTAYGWAHVNDQVWKANMKVTLGRPWSIFFSAPTAADPLTQLGDSGGGSFVPNYWGRSQLLAGIHSVGSDTFSIDGTFDEAMDWVQRTVYPDHGLFCHDLVCSTTLTSVPNYASYSTTFAPCSGAWDYEASFDTETRYDFIKLDGVAYSGEGSIRMAKPAGSSLLIEFTTDVSVPSLGLTLLRARCQSGAPSLGGRVALRPDGTMVMVVRTSDKYLVFGQRSTATGVGAANWSWSSLGAPLPFASEPVLIPNQDGRLLLVVRGTDNRLYTRTETSAGSRSFSTWTTLHPSAPIAGEPLLAGEPSLARDGSGRLVVFSLAATGEVLTAVQRTPGGAWSDWGSQWLAPNLSLTSSPVVTINANGRFSMFARGNDGALWLMRLREDGFQVFGDAVSLGGALPNADVLAAGPAGDTRLSVLANSSGAGMSYLTQGNPGSRQWSGWGSLTGTTSNPYHPSSAANHDGRLSAFITADGKLQFTSQDSVASASFGSWVSLGTDAASPPLAIKDATGIIHAFVLDSGGMLREVLQTSKNSTSFSSWANGKIGGPLAGL